MYPHINGVEWISLDHTQPWAGKYVREQSHKNSTIQINFNNDKGKFLPCVVGQHFKYTHFCRDIYTIHKIAAIFDAVSNKKSENIIWMDSDAEQILIPDHVFWKWHSQYDIVTTFRNGQIPSPETGIMYFSVNTATDAVLHAARSFYFIPSLYNIVRGVNDVRIFQFLLFNSINSTKMLKVGDYRTAPFDIAKYIKHHKSHGPMSIKL